jgi:hypothetical protein
MHYDGLEKPGERFEFFPLSKCQQATKERSIGIATYEILNESETRDFLDDSFDWSIAFAAQGTYHVSPTTSLKGKKKDDIMKDEEDDSNSDRGDDDGDDSDDTEELDRRLKILLAESSWKQEDKKEEHGQKEEKKKNKQQKEHAKQTKSRQQTLWESLPETSTMREKLQNLAKEIKESSPKKKNNEPRKSSRIPPGFSLRNNVQQRGPQSTCKGCKKKIGYTDKCIIHSYIAKTNHTHPTVERFHCTAQCLEKMRKTHLESFLEKTWTDKDLTQVKKEIKKK